jgi:3',5'-cyclic AMP phosphodiesterase CpdA
MAKGNDDKRQRELVNKLIQAANQLSKQNEGKADHVIVSPDLYEKIEEMKEYIEILERMKNRNKGIDDVLNG